jgi:hypothetical protein
VEFESTKGKEVSLESFWKNNDEEDNQQFHITCSELKTLTIPNQTLKNEYKEIKSNLIIG